MRAAVPDETSESTDPSYPIYDVPNSDLIGGPILAEETLAALAGFWESLQPVDRLILEERILALVPLTLEALGQQAGLTRERIRQREKTVKNGLQELSDRRSPVGYWMVHLASSVRHSAGPVVTESDLQERVATVFPDADGLSTDSSVTEIARLGLRKELGYIHCGTVCFDKAAVAVVEDLKDAARSIADSTGLIDESTFRSYLPDQTWHQYWDVLVGKCGLFRLSGCLALRDTLKARTKAALLSIGRPATREEVGALCGLEPARVGAQMSVIAGVVRADKKRWGLAQWVDEEYSGISAEVVQRIEEDGGATPLARLIDELPGMFEVSENSVRAYVGTPKFSLVDGYVSVADTSHIALRPLSDVVHGHTADGRPYWRFKVEDRYLKGYSLASLPPEIVNALGCEPGGRIRVPVSDPVGCRPISVNWPLDSTAGANIGYLSEPLCRLGACSGDHALIVIDSPDSASLRLDTPTGERGNTMSLDTAEPSNRARDLLDRIKNRRRGL